MFLKNLKVALKLIISFTIVVVLMVALAVVSVSQMNTVEEDYTIAIEGPLTVREAVRDFQVNFREVRIAMLFIVANTGINPEECAREYEAGLNMYENSLVALQNAAEAISSNSKMTDEDKKPRLDKVEQIRKLLVQYHDEMIGPMNAIMNENDPAAALAHMTAYSHIPSQIRENADQMLATSVSTSDDYVANAHDAAGFATTLMIVIAAVAAVISGILAVSISSMISKPLKPLNAFMKRAGSTGDLVLLPEDVESIGKYAHIKDEIGETIGACSSFVNRIIEISQILEVVANGDISQDIKLLSNADTMGLSLKKMVENLNHMFSEIRTSSSQVTMGSSQIADGAQSLASGSTEQAATLEELSASIASVSEQTKENADRTETASRLAESIMQNAEKGNRQMEQMIAAVNEINQANQNISKVIAAIDGIAFQTNILALNAAVEAARAGTAGKGFAVVADEVRTLSAKSANSAQETETLIADSMEKARLGTQIAGETAASLNEIVTGIRESARIISEIAKSSEDQFESISQINMAIGGVTQVVQQNSATAEESAAASEEMSGQANVLEDLISQFKLK